MTTQETKEELAALVRHEIGLEGDIHGPVLDVKQHPKGEWVRYQDVTNAMSFVTGYLGEHRDFLMDRGTHPAIVASVQHIIDEIEGL